MTCPNEYTCAACNGTFHRDPEVWTEEDALEEFRMNHGRDKSDDDVIICDGCYQKLLAKLLAMGLK